LPAGVAVFTVDHVTRRRIVLLLCAGLLVAGAAPATAKKATTPRKPVCPPTYGVGTCLYPERPGRDQHDVDVAIGATVKFVDWAVTAKQPGLVINGKDGRMLAVPVTLLNRTSAPLPYSAYSFELQTLDGSRFESYPNRRGGGIADNGTLAPGKQLAGTLMFEMKARGTYYLTFRPSPTQRLWAVWRFTV
jgi:hypothetical protein